MTVFKAMVLGTLLLFGLAAWAQEFPRVELGFDYSYARYSPSAPYTQGHSLNGGGGSFTFNLTQNFGIKAELQGYGSTLVGFNVPPNSTFSQGLKGNVEGNLFTYLFGPQVKIRAEKFQPFVHALFGAAHSNMYAHAYNVLCGSTNCGFVAPSSDAFAMAVGGGIDIPVTKMIAIRPAGLDYLMTRFNNPFTGTNNQHNFRYTAGVVFNLAHTH